MRSNAKPTFRDVIQAFPYAAKCGFYLVPIFPYCSCNGIRIFVDYFNHIVEPPLRFVSLFAFDFFVLWQTAFVALDTFSLLRTMFGVHHLEYEEHTANQNYLAC